MHELPRIWGFLVLFHTIWGAQGLLQDPWFGLLGFMRDSLQNLFNLFFLLQLITIADIEGEVSSFRILRYYKLAYVSTLN